MIAEKLENIKLLDCTIRDGGYLNNWQFDKKVVREVYRSVSDSGCDIFEIGFKSSSEYFNRDNYGLFRFCDEDVVREVTSGISGCVIGAMIDYGMVNISDISDKDDSVIDLIRVAAHKDKLSDAMKFIELIKNKGYETSIQMMGYSTFTKDEQKDAIKLLKDSNVDYAYIADSYGSILPYQIREMLEPLLDIQEIKIGFHPHNSLQMAFANTLEAISVGVHIIDASIYGMGRGAGNLPIEIILSYFQQHKPEKYNVIPILHCIDKYFIDFQKNTSWGYQLPYMISGIFNCHPYYAKTLIDWREYTIDDVWNVLGKVCQQEPIGYSESMLKQIVGTTLHGEIDGVPEYIDRHKGRNFLVLANGPNLKKFKEKIDDFIKKYDPVILGANYLGGLFLPHYHAFTNKRRFIEYIGTVDPGSTLILSTSFKDELIKSYTEKKYEKLYHIYKENGDFKIIDGKIYSGYYTVSTLLIPLAHVIGANRIFVAGMDGYGNLDKKQVHFYKETDEASEIEIELEKQRKSEVFLDQINNYLKANDQEQFHIITPTSYSKHYHDIDNYF